MLLLPIVLVDTSKKILEVLTNWPIRCPKRTNSPLLLKITCPILLKHSICTVHCTLCTGTVKVLDVQSSITDPNPIGSGPFWSDPGFRSEATKIDIILPLFHFFHKTFHLPKKSLKYANFSSLWSGSWTGSGSSPKRPDLTKKVRIHLGLNPQHCSVPIILYTVLRIRDPILFYPLDPGSGSWMSYLFDFKDFFLKP
jgi:hypothetical protein